jgi:hypothetical protein
MAGRRGDGGMPRIASERRARLARAGTAVALAAILLLGSGATRAPAQAPVSQQADEQAVPFDLTPELVTKPKETTPTPVPEPTDVPQAASPTTTVAAPPSKQDRSIRTGVGSAQLQSLASKRREARRACVPKARALPISSMLGRPGSVGGGATSKWIGYPRRTKDLKRFEGQLRLVDPRGRILQMAATGPMGASEYRYAC